LAQPSIFSSNGFCQRIPTSTPGPVVLGRPRFFPLTLNRFGMIPVNTKSRPRPPFRDTRFDTRVTSLKTGEAKDRGRTSVGRRALPWARNRSSEDLIVYSKPLCRKHFILFQIGFFAETARAGGTAVENRLPADFHLIVFQRSLCGSDFFQMILCPMSRFRDKSSEPNCLSSRLFLIDKISKGPAAQRPKIKPQNRTAKAALEKPYMKGRRRTAVSSAEKK
jgi:hypothetical protein